MRHQCIGAILALLCQADHFLNGLLQAASELQDQGEEYCRYFSATQV